RDVVQTHDERAGIPTGRDVRRDDLVEEPSDAPAAVADVDGGVDRGDATGRVVRRPPGLLDDGAHGDVRLPPPAPDVTDPVDLTIEIVELALGDRRVDDVPVSFAGCRRLQRDRHKPGQ